MTALLRAMYAEILKLKRTLALRLSIIAPAAVVIYCMLMFWGEQAGPDSRPWIDYMSLARIFWTLLMLPLFVTLQAALLGGLEHRNGQWKQLFAQPVPRPAVYMAKQIAVALLMLLSFVALAGFMVLGGMAMRLAQPQLGFHAAIPWNEMLQPLGAAYLASWLLMAIHTWIAMRWKSFALASAVGMVLTVAGVVIINSDWGSFYPWAMPGVIVNQFSKGMSLLRPELIFGCIGGIVVALLGCWDVTRRDVL